MKKRIGKVLKAVVPPSVGTKLHLLFDDQARAAREAREQEVPRVRLSERHIQNCELLVDRQALLERLPTGGVVAELGVDRGGFSRQILDATTPATLHLVDVWASERYHDGLFDLVRSSFGAEIASGQVQIHRDTSVAAAADFADASLDWVYIDTDHSYETTRDELAAYAPKVKPGGILAGHDYVVGNWVAMYRYGVVEAVHEFCVARDWELLYLTTALTEKPSFAIRRIGDA